MHYIRQPHRGAGAARNAGIRASDGEFVAFLDSDDLWQPDKTERQLEVMRRWPEVVFVTGTAMALRADGRRDDAWPAPIPKNQPIDLAPALFDENLLLTPTVMVRRQKLEQAGLFREDLPRSQDYHLWVRLACRGPAVYLDAHLATVAADTPGSLQRDREAAKLWNVQARRSLRRELRLRPDCRPIWHRALARQLAMLRDQAYERGRFGQAARWAVRYLWHNRWHSRRWEWWRAAQALWRTVIDWPAFSPLEPTQRSPAEVRQALRTADAGYRNNGRVTVVLTTYNRADLLPRAIESALAQTVAHLCDIVIVDDGSTDHTRQVAARYADKVQYVYRENGGLAAARNTGILARPNEFVAFLDDDDEWEPDKTERQLEAFRRWPEAVLIAGRATARYADGRTRPHRLPPLPLNRPVDFAPLLFEDNYLSVPMVLVRRRHLEQVGLHREELRRRQDYHLWTRLACLGPFVYLDAPVCTYSADSADGLSYNRQAAMRATLRVHKLLKRELWRRPDCRPNWHAGMARCYAILRDQAYRHRRFAAALGYGVLSFWHRPWPRQAWELRRLAAAALRALVPHPHLGRAK